MEKCLFCERDNKEEHKIILENELFYSRWCNFPVSKGHAHVVPKKHIESFFELTEEEVKAMYSLIKQTKEIIDKYNPDSYNIGINNGKEAGRSIPHLHIHIIPRYKGDTLHPEGGIKNILPKGNYIPELTEEQKEYIS
jgi:diadenosine tetraphosphate (Ap4A) HIT family hydrolase